MEKLQLDHNKLTGPIPASMGQLKALEVLCLHENNLDNGASYAYRRVARNPGLLLDEDKRKRNTYRRLFDRYKIQNPIPECLADIPHLYKFYAYDNQLSGTLLPRIKERMNANNQWKLVDQQDDVKLT